MRRKAPLRAHSTPSRPRVERRLKRAGDYFACGPIQAPRVLRRRSGGLPLRRCSRVKGALFLQPAALTAFAGREHKKRPSAPRASHTRGRRTSHSSGREHQSSARCLSAVSSNDRCTWWVRRLPRENRRERSRPARRAAADGALFHSPLCARTCYRTSARVGDPERIRRVSVVQAPECLHQRLCSSSLVVPDRLEQFALSATAGRLHSAAARGTRRDRCRCDREG